MIKIRGAVVTGFEFAACEELTEKFGVQATSSRGAVVFDLPNDANLCQLLQLRSIDSLYAIIDSRQMETVCDRDKAIALQSIAALQVELDWKSGLQALEHVTNQPLAGGLQRALDALGSYRDTLSKYSGDKNGLPSYRVTCYRPGLKELHSFGSMDAARALGNVVNNCFGWTPNMEDFDIEVILHINNAEVWTGLSLNKTSLHCRNIVRFGPTALRSTICHGLLRMVTPRPGQIVVDPMCGGGSIPLEAATAWPDLFVFGGDNHPAALERCRENLQAIYSSSYTPANTSDCSSRDISAVESSTHPTNPLMSPVVFLQWDATALPLGDESVDCIVTDLPFGKRMGSRADNRQLYPALLVEWARVLKPDGRVAALTHDRRTMGNMVARSSQLGRLWRITDTHHVNIGGLICVAYLLVKRAGKTS